MEPKRAGGYLGSDVSSLRRSKRPGALRDPGRMLTQPCRFPIGIQPHDTALRPSLDTGS
jgi:hypothetical protein